ncbi:hypothetical protein DFH28DRAFT_1134989 [Melampsora americana]|nr:hypothetical protein DFH28DRAFT_1134989 [Melampsora americana]
MSSPSLKNQDTAQTTPTTRGCMSPEVWVESVCSFQAHSLYCASWEEQHRRSALAVAQSRANHIDPRLLDPAVNLATSRVVTPRVERPGRPRGSSHTVNHILSPTGRREVERLEEYIRLRDSKQKMRRIIKLIQDKRCGTYSTTRAIQCLKGYNL